MNINKTIIFYRWKAATVLRISFLNDWALDSFGCKHYELGIEALTSQTCVNLLKKVNTNPKQVDTLNRDYTSDPSEIAEKNTRKFYSNFH